MSLSRCPPNRQQASLTELDGSKTCTIPPGQFGFLLTEEVVRVPYNAIAFISVRATYKFMGLVNVSGFHVDPGWEGPLIFAVFNGGPSPVTVKRFDELFHIWFADLDSAATAGEAKRPKSEGIGSEVINGLGDQVISLASLSDSLEKIEREHQQISQATATKIALHIAILGALLAIAAGLWLSPKPGPAVQLDQRSNFSLPNDPRDTGALPIDRSKRSDNNTDANGKTD